MKKLIFTFALVLSAGNVVEAQLTSSSTAKPSERERYRGLYDQQQKYLQQEGRLKVLDRGADVFKISPLSPAEQAELDALTKKYGPIQLG